MTEPHTKRERPKVPVCTAVQPYPLTEANRALDDLREGRVQGAAVLVVGTEYTDRTV